jgi:hypothetical protein
MHDHDPIDFTMTDLPTRPGPCRKAAAEETDATAAALARQSEEAIHVAEAIGLRTERVETLIRQADRLIEAVEVKYGSGKVKV